MAQRGRRLLAVCFTCAFGLWGWAPGAMSQQNAVGRMRTRSEISGVALVPFDRLPHAAATRKVNEFCSGYVAKPVSSAAQVVQSRGWIVTGEARLGTFTAVSFAASMDPATSGTCYVRDGNIGIFDDDQLFALAFSPRGSQTSIGKVVSLEGGGARVWSGETLMQPLGDLQALDEGGELIRLGSLAPVETLCAGKAIVPNVYGISIDRARRTLMRAGWSPVPTDPTEDSASGREKDMRRRGITEVESCSGTGFGFCSFAYRGPAGTLSLTTVGDDVFPSVSGYGVTCS